MPEFPKSALSWFEIPAVDLDRAVTFYEAIFAYPKGSMHRMSMPTGQMAMFPCQEGGIGGALWHDGETKPSQDGSKIYLSANGILPTVVARIAQAGGTVLCPHMSLGQWGQIAIFTDTEGNQVALHSM